MKREPVSGQAEPRPVRLLADQSTCNSSQNVFGRRVESQASLLADLLRQLAEVIGEAPFTFEAFSSSQVSANRSRLRTCSTRSLLDFVKAPISVRGQIHDIRSKLLVQLRHCDRQDRHELVVGASRRSNLDTGDEITSNLLHLQCRNSLCQTRAQRGRTPSAKRECSSAGLLCNSAAIR